MSVATLSPAVPSMPVASSTTAECPGCHGLQHGIAPETGLSCDICDQAIAASADAFSCRTCNFDACKTCFVGGFCVEEVNGKKVQSRLRKYVDQVRRYGDKDRQTLCRRSVPASMLRSQQAAAEVVALAAAEEASRCHLLELLRWFKIEFFRWTDSPSCDACGQKTTKNEGMGEPCEEELRYGATRVEQWRCVGCDAVSRFPRYNDPARLLETRHGRCGEWANCFTLCLVSLGFDARLVVDWTDHVWSEVRLGDRWVHCDPCEMSLDAPLTYEAGWGKKLTYVIAFGQNEVVDVTSRYTNDWQDVLTRRRLVSEEALAKFVADADIYTRESAAEDGCNGPLPHPPWWASEIAELEARRLSAVPNVMLNAAEQQGRISGSVNWRQERGESGAAAMTIPVIVQIDAPRAWTLSFVGLDAATTAADGVAELSATSANAVTCTPIASLTGGAVLIPEGSTSNSDGESVAYVDLSACGATIEIATAAVPAPALGALAPVSLGQDDAFMSPEGFTAEVWVSVKASLLHDAAHMNPAISKHGPGSGWELRLCRQGGAVFLVTINGMHIEVSSNDGSGVDHCVKWEEGKWVHVAGSFDGQKVRVFLAGRLVAEAAVPAVGERSPFLNGPLLLGRNPAWRDRGARCRLCAARITHAALEPVDFLPLPVPAPTLAH
eukprot:TRINITY_DN54599_c0_g1_i1.p1 TRINITY_DN54599_c0_g1~~TRINITY_DN54599_c0_g1_i1.p1  ORF type:complete len:688 (-),score=123.35 TRINITY_DN54599_c0_g1_i1:264-2261(-)